MKFKCNKIELWEVSDEVGKLIKWETQPKYALYVYLNWIHTCGRDNETIDKHKEEIAKVIKHDDLKISLLS